MIIERNQYASPCVCGQTHRMATKAAIIEAGCLRNIDTHLTNADITGRRAVLYDTYTYEAAKGARPAADQEIILNADGLRADKAAVDETLRQLSSHTEVLIAIGAGTIHDIARYCAHRLGLVLVACPTAASTDGYASDICSMVWHDIPTLLPGVAPSLILADLEIIKHAPAHLTRGGVGDAISKHTALADWRIAALLTGDQPACIAIESMLRQAAVAAEGACEGLRTGDRSAYAQLMYALLLPGLAMQMAGDAAPAYGGEHMLCHLLEMLPDTAEGLSHGERAGICTVLTADLYHRLAEIDDIAAYIKPYQAANASTLAKTVGDTAAQALMAENAQDCLCGVRAETIITQWEAIRRIVEEIPEAQTLSAMLASIGAENEPEALGLTGAKLSRLLHVAPYLRNQPTLARLTQRLRFRYASKAEASRAPSRKSRYADSAITRAGNSKAMSASSMR